MNNMPTAVNARPTLMPRLWADWFNLPAYLLAWSMPGFAALSFYYLNQTLSAQPLNWSYAVISTLPNWYIWALLTGAMDPAGLMVLALAAYAAYVINAGQFLLKLRAARLQAEGAA
jgi:hypothetical protein